ncbi:MAG: hypothetical protein CTY31_02180 [Hyphomicrobium sp.]|nr:MAG: hypothetical protein CTY39_00480 [Hyphomicrobium sp.]PPD01583.1 MAG: hypothetical protein CTY31_02180 [Hyphomicrobium sp.]
MTKAHSLASLLARPAKYKRSSLWLGIMASFLFVCLLILVVMVYGPPAILMAPWDHFLLLDEAWRIRSGLIPHTDFYNPIGPLTYLLVAAGEALGHANIAAISHGAIIFAVVALPCIILVAFSRLQPWLACLVAVFLITLALAVRPLGFTEQETSYAMLYNRQGWVLLSILLLQSCIPIASKCRSLGYIDETLGGLLLSLLFFCKISFFIVACAAVAARIIWRGSIEVEKSLTLITAFFSIVALFAAMSWVGLFSYLQDISMAAAAQDITSRWREIKTLILGARIPLAGFAVIGLMSLAAARHAHAMWWSYAQLLATGALFLGATLLLSAGNAGESSGRDLPLLFVGTVVVANVLCKISNTHIKLTRNLNSAILILSSVLFLLPTMARDVASIAKLLQNGGASNTASDAVITFKSKHLDGFLIRSDVTWKTVFTRSAQVPEWIDDGLTLLNETVDEKSRLAVLGYGDPFSATLGLPPAHGMPIWLVPNISFNRHSHPTSQTVLGNADYVMVPVISSTNQGCCQEFVEELMAVYGIYLSQHFTQTKQSQHWTLYQRNENGGQQLNGGN